MIKVGLTGGIGSGKTSVAKVFEKLNVPVFYADDESKNLLKRTDVIAQVVTLFGNSILEKNQIDKKKLAQLVFNNETELKKLNALLHPLVQAEYEFWLKKHSEKKFTIKEAAILFESGSYKNCDKIICVTCNEEERINRVMKRDKTSRESILARIKNQWTEEQRIQRSDFIIKNESNNLVVPQIISIVEQIDLL